MKIPKTFLTPVEGAEERWAKILRMLLSLQELRQIYGKLESDARLQQFYSKFPRNMFWDAENKATSTGILRDASDLPDMIRRMQNTYLFGVNTASDVKHLAVEWLTTRYGAIGIDMRSMPADIEESQHSDPAICVDWFGRRLSIDFLRTVSAGYDIRRYAQQGQPPLRVLELGAGLGHLARTLRLMGISRSHIIIDLPESLVFSYAFLMSNFPEASAKFVSSLDEAREIRVEDYDFVFIPSGYADQTDFSGADLFLNTASLGEMRNETIRYWMDFVQQKTRVKYLFTQNRFLNTIQPGLHAWRWEENEASVHYDAGWAIRKWELEPVWFQCPYIVPISARHLEIAAARVQPMEPPTATRRAGDLLSEVKLQDWYTCLEIAPHMTMRENQFVIDGTMTGALFKLWESIRLFPTAETVYVLLRYLECLIHGEDIAFEETQYYEKWFLELVEGSSDPVLRSYAAKIRAPENRQAARVGAITMRAETRDYNIVSVERFLPERSEQYFAVAKSLGQSHLFAERLGDRELAPYLLVSDSMEGAKRLAEIQEHAHLQVAGGVGEGGNFSREAVPVLMGSYRGFNLVAHKGRSCALRNSLGPVEVSDGEIELERRFGPNDVLFADTVDAVRTRIDIVEIARQLAAFATELASLRLTSESKPTTRKGELAAVRAALEAETAARDGKITASIAELRNSVEETRQATQAGLEAAAHQTEDRLKTLDEKLRTQEVLEGLRELHAELGMFSQEVRITESRLAGDLQQVNTVLQTLARDLQRLSRTWTNRLLGIFSR